MKRLRFAVLVGVLGAALAAASGALAAGGKPLAENIPYDQTPLLQGRDYGKLVASTNPDGSGDSATPPLHDGRSPDITLTLFDLSSDPTRTSPNGSYRVPFWKEYAGANADIYVAWNDLAAPASSSQQDQTIATEQVALIGQEFDQKIWASDVFHFGNYKARCPGQPVGDNSCGDGKRAAIYVYNIRDDAYWTSYRFYIAGYFWSSLNNYLGRNAIFVDSFNWSDRTGPNSARPRLYEGTVAHEFEHLIQNDVDPDEDSFIDEGMADLAEQFVYGTTTTASHIGNYLYYNRDSLTDWDGELYDYGNGALWQDYLWERAGGRALDAPLAERLASGYALTDESADKFTDPGDRFVWNLIHDQANGLQGVANQVGGMDRVSELYRNFTLANLLDGRVPNPEWNYRNLVLGSQRDSLGYTIDDGIAFYDSNVNGNMPPTRKNVRRRTVVEPWGAYYRAFWGSQPGFTYTFRGNAEDGVAAHSLPYHWYSGLGNMLDISVSRSFAVNPGDTLKFWTWFDIEENWDYGYVEASTDGVNWTKLAQVSGLQTGSTNIYGSSAWDGPGGFTGSSGGYQPAEFSFGGLTGTVQVRFRYRTDEAVNGQGWYVDDVQVGSTTDAVASPAGWTNNGFQFTTGQQQNRWSADTAVFTTKAQTTSFAFSPVGLLTSGNTVSGSTWIDTQYVRNGQAYGIVSNRPAGAFDATGSQFISKSQG